MGTTLDPPDGVLGIAAGPFFPNSLLKPLFTAQGKRNDRNEA